MIMKRAGRYCSNSSRRHVIPTHGSDYSHVSHANEESNGKTGGNQADHIGHVVRLVG